MQLFKITALSLCLFASRISATSDATTDAGICPVVLGEPSVQAKASLFAGYMALTSLTIKYGYTAYKNGKASGLEFAGLSSIMITGCVCTGYDLARTLLLPNQTLQ